MNPASIASRDEKTMLKHILSFISVPSLFAEAREPFGNIRIPRLDRPFIARIEANLATTPAQKALRSLVSFFPYDFCQYQAFLEHFSCNPLLPHHTLVPLMAFIHWIGQENPSDMAEHFDQLVDLLFLIEKHNASVFQFCLISSLCHFLHTTMLPFPIASLRRLFYVCSPNLFALAGQALARSVNTNKPESVHFLVGALADSISRDPAAFSNCDFASLAALLAESLTELDFHAVSLMAILAAARFEDGVAVSFSSLPAVLLGKVESLPVVHPAWAIPNATIIDCNQSTSECTESWGEIDDDVVFPLSNLASEIQVNDLLSDAHEEMINCMVVMLARVLPPYVNIFFDRFVSILANMQGRPHGVDFFLCFIVILSRSPGFSENLISTLISKPIFTPGISIFEIGDEFEIVNFMREQVISLVVARMPRALATLLETQIGHPFLFVETLVRIQTRCWTFDILLCLTDSVIRAIVHVFTLLTSFAPRGDRDLQVKTYKAGKAIALFFVAVCGNCNVATRCMSQKVFASGFLPRVVDPGLRDLHLAVFRALLKNIDPQEQSSSEALTEAILETLSIYCSLVDTAAPENVVNTILLFVHEVICGNRYWASRFGAIINAATLFLKAHPSSDILQRVIQIYVQMLLLEPDFKLTFDAVLCLLDAIRAADGIAPSEATATGLIEMLARSMSASFSNVFFVRQPMIFLPLLGSAQTETHMGRCLDLIRRLCSHSAHNALQCHLGEVDLLLLAFVRHFPNKFRYRNREMHFVLSEESIMELLLTVVFQIAAVASTPHIVAKMISASAPSVDRVFPVFSFPLMTHIESTLSTLLQNPTVTLVLGMDDRRIPIATIDSSTIAGGFTFEGFVRYDGIAGIAANRMPAILTLEGPASTSIVFYFQGLGLTCRVMLPNVISGGLLTTAFPNCEWTKITLIISRTNEESSSVLVSLGDGLTITFAVSFAGFPEGLVTITLGGIYEPSADSDPAISLMCELGPFRFLPRPLSHVDVYKIYEQRIRRVEITGPCLCSEKSECLAKEFSPVKHDFKDALSYKHSVRSFLPFFFFVAEMPPHFPELLLDVLHSMMSFCAQKSRYWYSFPVIAHMLLQCPTDRLTYALYLKFFGFFEGSTEPSVVAALTLHGLFNFELWYAADGPHLLRIVRHWSQTLFPTAQAALTQYYSFSDILSLIRIYFWFDPVEHRLIKGGPGSHRPRASNLNIDSCRSTLNRLVVSMCDHPGFPTNEDVDAILYNVTTCDSRQVSSFLSLFVELCRLHCHETMASDEALKVLYCDLRPENPRHFRDSIELLYLMSGFSFHRHLHVILGILNPTFFTEELFSECLTLLPRCPTVYSLCARLALNLNESRVIQVAEQLPSIDSNLAATIVCDQLWFVWPMMMLLSLPTGMHEFVFAFFVNVITASEIDTIANLDAILNAFDLLAFCATYEVEAMAQRFLARVAQDLFDTVTPELSAALISRCLKALLLYIHEPPIAALPLLFAESPFAEPTIATAVPLPRITSHK
jgi:hypothetical protein